MEFAGHRLDEAATLARERGLWLLRHLASEGREVDLEEVRANMADPDADDLDVHRRRMADLATRLGVPFVVDGEPEGSAGETTEASFFVTGAKGRRWVVTCEIEPVGPGRIQRIRIERRLPDGIEIRDAVPADGPALAELYRSIAMRAGDMRVTIDPGDDFFAMTRLMEEPHTLVATENGQPIGVYGGVLFPGSLNGEPVVVALGCHSRIVAGKEGGGVWSNMNIRLLARFEGRYQVPLAFVLAGNSAASRLTTAGAWPAVPERAVIACSSEATIDVGRPATPDDAEVIADILNATHGGQDLYRPRTAADVAARLERAPDLYGWSDVWLTDDAMVGIGRVFHGRCTETPDGRVDSMRAVVFDYGARPGADDELHALLQARGHEAGRRGATHLSVFTTAPSRLYQRLVSVAESVESYDLLVPGHQPDEGAAERGVFVDQIYF